MPEQSDAAPRFFSFHRHLDKAAYKKFSWRLTRLLLLPAAVGLFLLSSEIDDLKPFEIVVARFSLIGLIVCFLAMKIFLLNRSWEISLGAKFGRLFANVFLLALGFAGIVFLVEILYGCNCRAEVEVSEAMSTAAGAETGLAEFYQNQSRWPVALASVYSTAAYAAPIGKYVEHVGGKGEGVTYALQATLRNDGSTRRSIAGESIVIWTTDGGNTWHCQPSNALGFHSDIPLKDLPTECRE